MAQPQRKKVIFLITKSNFGGAQRYVLGLATHIPRDRYEIAVAHGGTGEVGSGEGELAKKLRERGIRTIHVPSLGRDIRFFSDIVSFFAIMRLIRAERPNILHLNSSKAAGLGAFAGRIMRVPRIIYTAHGWPFWEDRLFVIRAIIFLFSWLTVLLAHKTICVSEYDRKRLLHFPLMRSRLVSIRNGIEPIEHPIDRTVARATLFDVETAAAHVSHIWVATIAELHANKNLSRAIDAVIEYNRGHDTKIFYTIIGDGELGHALMKKSDRNISLIGHLSEAPRYLNAFDIFLLPSLKEGLPYAMLEAGVAGLPVVASNVGGIPEILGDARDGYLIDPKSADDIVRGLNDAVLELKNPKPGTSLFSVIRERCSQKNMLQQTFGLYESSELSVNARL